MGVPIRRTIVFGGLYWVPPLLGNYHMSYSLNPLMGGYKGLYGDNGKENGNYYKYWGYIGMIGYIGVI